MADLPDDVLRSMLEAIETCYRRNPNRSTGPAYDPDDDPSLEFEGYGGPQNTADENGVTDDDAAVVAAFVDRRL